jgi:uncharacterized protein with ATP-grasp and redox domains
MNTSLDCIPCIIRQALEAARFMTTDASVHEQTIREVLTFTATMDLNLSPPVAAQRIHRRLREILGEDDPYRDVKNQFNRMAKDLLPELSAQIKTSTDPLATAVRLAIAGNVIDLGVNGNISESQAHHAMMNTMSEPFWGDLDEFRRTISDAKDILYLGDNAGEIIFDALLLKHLKTMANKITFAVRGGPILNDATMPDAEFAGICDLVEVIDNGSDAPGTILDDCSDSFQKRFNEAGLILAKGQGNYETLSDVNANIFFLFKAKCPVIASQVGQPVGTHVLLRSKQKT